MKIVCQSLEPKGQPLPKYGHIKAVLEQNSTIAMISPFHSMQRIWMFAGMRKPYKGRATLLVLR